MYLIIPEYQIRCIIYQENGIRKKLLAESFLPLDRQQQQHYSNMHLHFCILVFYIPHKSRNI